MLVVAVGLLFQMCSNQNAINYAESNNWAKLPPSKLLDVDVFFVSPSVYVPENEKAPALSPICNKSIEKNMQRIYTHEASVFEGVANIYMPYYRQMSRKNDQKMSEMQREQMFQQSVSDVENAFNYFIKNLNNNRPFILAGQAEGSEIIMKLLSNYLKDKPDIYERMVAAYVIGFPVTTDFLKENPHLEFAKKADDYRVLISFSTKMPQLGDSTHKVNKNSSIAVINPITWTRTTETAEASQSKGSRIAKTGAEIADCQNFADAKIDSVNGVVLCSIADSGISRGLQILPASLFPSIDYGLYYYDIRANALARTRAYFANR